MAGSPAVSVAFQSALAGHGYFSVTPFASAAQPVLVGRIIKLTCYGNMTGSTPPFPPTCTGSQMVRSGLMSK